jgi:hypothetical protein
MFVKSADDLPADFGHIDGRPDLRDEYIVHLKAMLEECLWYVAHFESVEESNKALDVWNRACALLRKYDRE